MRISSVDFLLSVTIFTQAVSLLITLNTKLSEGLKNFKMSVFCEVIFSVSSVSVSSVFATSEVFQKSKVDSS
jgi:hypothetical protein